MAVSVRFSAATVAALVTLTFGVQVAHAGGLGDIIGDPVAAADDAVLAVQQAAPDAQGTVDETVGQTSDTAEAVAEPVGDAVASTNATSTVNHAIADSTSTAQDTAGAVGDAVDQTTATTPVSDVVDTATSAVDQATQTLTGQLPGPLQDLVGQVTSQVTGTVAGATKTVGEIATVVRATSAPASAVPTGTTSRPATTGQSVGNETAAGIVTSGVSAGAMPVAGSTPQTPARSSLTTMLLNRAGRYDSSLQPIPAWLSAGQRGGSGPASPRTDDPRLPLPLLPFSIPAGAAPPAGAAGAALLALLLGAFVLATPRTGRRLRPGPILGWSPPFLSRQERPG